MVRHARRVDANHGDIRSGLRALGWEVLDLSGAGGGVPDLCVKLYRDGEPFKAPHFLEVKDGDKPLSKQALTPAQEEWHRFCHPITSKVRSLEEAITALEWARGRA